MKKKNPFVLYKASGSTEATKEMASGTLVDTTGQNINQNTATMASMFTQMNSTKSIMIIIIVGIVAFLIFKYQNK